MGLARVKTADPKNVTARMKLRPGSSLAPPAAIDIDIVPDTLEIAPTGYRYIKSMAKLIAAWIASCGLCSPKRWMDLTLWTTNQIMSAAKLNSHPALGPKAHLGTNMPAMDTPIQMCAMSTSRPEWRRPVTEKTNNGTE
jgi:hypothetical protein